LWAAFASTKAAMAREYLASDAKQDKIGTGAVDKANLGDSPFESTKNKIWITRTQPNSLFFETGPMDPSKTCDQRKEGDEAGIDKTRPFFVKINGANWISMKMAPIPDSDDKTRMQWVGEIYGLSPTFSYQVHFIRSDDDAELHSETIVTPALTRSDESPSQAVHLPVLPSSPASPKMTLKVSIHGCETRVEELLEKRKRFIKENGKTLGSLRKEIDVLNEKISNQVESMKSVQQKQTRENQHIRQAEDAITSFTQELDDWKEIPEGEIAEHQLRKTEYEATKGEQREAKNKLVKTKEANMRAVQAIQSEGNNTAAKNIRLEQRITRLKGQYEQLLSPGTASGGPIVATSGAADAARSNSDGSISRSQKHQNKIQSWENMIEGRQRLLDSKQAEYQMKMQELQQLQHLESSTRFRPITPSDDQIFHNAAAHTSANSARFFDSYTQHPFSFGTPERSSSNLFDPFTPATSLLHKTNSTGGYGMNKQHSGSLANPRPRSTSIMSGNTIYQDVDEGSGGTDGTAYEPFPSVPFGNPGFPKRRSGGIGLVREGSNGGSSGSGSPRVLGGITRPPPPRETPRESLWNAS